MGQLIELLSTGIPGPAGPPGASGALTLNFTGSSGLLGQAYSASAVATGGTPPYTFSISAGSLPTGLSPINTSTGAITGTPSVAGSFSFTVEVTDTASATATVSCTVVINGAPESPYSVVLTEVGPRTLASDQTTLTTLQVVIQELTSGYLGNQITVQISSNNGAGWYTFAIVDPTSSPTVGGYRVTTVTVPDILCMTVSQNYKAQAWTANAYASNGAPGAVVSSAYAVPAIGPPSANFPTIFGGGTFHFTSGTSGTSFVFSSFAYPTTDITGNVLAASTSTGLSFGLVVSYNTSTHAGVVASWSGASPVSGNTCKLYLGASLVVTNFAGSAPTPVNIYMGLSGAGNPYWLLNCTLSVPGGGDPNAWYYADWLEWQNASGAPINPGGVNNTSGWQQNQFFPNTTQASNQNYNFQIIGNYAGPGIDAYFNITVWGISRSALASVAPYTGDSNCVIQTAAIVTVHIGIAPTGNGSNMLADPNFAQSAMSGSAIGWTQGAGGTYSYATITGGPGPSGIAISYGECVTGGAAGGWSQSFEVRSGDGYTYQEYVAVIAGTPSATKLQLQWFDASGSPVATTALTDITSSLTSSIQVFSVSGTVPTGAVKMTATLNWASGSSFTIYATNGYLAPSVGGALTKVGNQTTLAPGAITPQYTNLAAINSSSGALTTDAISTSNATQVIQALALVDGLIHDVGLNKLAATTVTQGTAVFTADAIFSRGNGQPVMVLQNSGSPTVSGLFLYSTCSISGGVVTPSTSTPYVALEAANGLLFYGGNVGGGNGPSVVVNSSGQILYSVHLDLTHPYTSFSPSGITIASSFGGANNYAMVIGSGSIQMLYNGTPYVTLNTSGLALGSGTSLTSPSISGGTITGATLTLIANGLTTKINNVSRFSLSNGLNVDDGYWSVLVGSEAITCCEDSGGSEVWSLGFSGPVGSEIAALSLRNNSAGFAMLIQAETSSSPGPGTGSIVIPANARLTIPIIVGSTTYYWPLL